MASYKPVTHCIFDMDGLLLDSEQIYRKAFAEVLARYGKDYSDEVRIKSIGKQPLDSLKTIIECLDMKQTPEKLGKEVRELLQTRIQNAKFKPGAEKLVKHLAAHRIPTAIATSCWRDMLEALKSHYSETFSFFHHIVASESDPEVKVGKPAPDIFLVCASRFDEKPPPEKCLVFEDSPAGVLAAKSAKMQVVMVPDAIVPQEQRDPATQVVNSLADFNPKDFGLPPY